MCCADVYVKVCMLYKGTCSLFAPVLVLRQGVHAVQWYV